jgi:hypothetical protein
MVLVTIILLNLLIAVISDVYEAVLADADMFAVRGKAELAVEVDSLVPVALRAARDAAVLAGERVLLLQKV